MTFLRYLVPGAARTARTARTDLRGVVLGVQVVLLAVFVIGGVLRDERTDQVPLLDIWLFNAIYVGSILLCAFPRARLPGMVLAWRLVAAALSTTVLANIAFSLLAGGTALSPGLAVGAGMADSLYAMAYPACYVAVVLAVRARVRSFLPSMWWDGVITGLGLAAVSCVVLAGGTLAAGAAPAEDLPPFWYPAADLVLLALLAACAAVLGAHWDRTLLTAALGLAVVACGDLVYLMQRVSGAYVEGGLCDTVNLAGVVLLGLGPGLREAEPARRGETGPRIGWPVLGLPAAATVGSVLVMALSPADLRLARLLAAGSVLAALVRMFGTLREIRDLGEAHRQARTDDLTGLLNRRAFWEHCDRIVREATPAAPAALVLLDLDRFKEVNDSLGHAAGDALLVAVAGRLVETLPPGTVVARLGGDEFAVVLSDAGEARALAVAADLGHVLGRGFLLGELTIRLTTSIGVALAPESADSWRELMRCADVAMYRAKADRDGPVLHTAVDAAGSRERLRTLEDLRNTLDGVPGTGRLAVHLQPQIRLDAGGVAGVEALVRWQHPGLGELPPAAFLAAARTAGLMGAVTAVVLDEALAACRSWWEQGHQVPVSVNVSAASVHDDALPAKVARALRRHRLPARALLIELTEDTLMTEPERARGVLEQLRALGVGVSIDDYGTGYSSLVYLRQLPVDELKLDRAFTRGLPDDPSAAAIIQHVVDLAHTLGLRLVVEGIEDQATLEAVARLGGDVAQGFHVARPMPLEDLLAWLAAYRPASPVPPARSRSSAAVAVPRRALGRVWATSVAPGHGSGRPAGSTGP